MPDEKFWEYYREITDKRFDKVDAKLDKLFAFMWIFIGISVALSRFGEKALEIATAFAGGK